MSKVPRVDLATLDKIAPDDLRLLWVNDWLDGPLEAVVEHRGEPCLMVLHGEDKGTDTYRWLLVRLSAEQRADEEKWHALFVEHVGDHWCFHGPTFPHPAPTGEPDPDKFWIPYRQRPTFDVSRNTVIGWADEMPAH